MQAVHTPLILYIPGLLPKQEAAVHKDALERCLLEGVRRADVSVAESIAASDHSFDIVSWTFDFYREHRNFELDRAAIDAVIEQQIASENDIREATSFLRRITPWLYRLGDMLPFLIPHLATERMELHIRDLLRYVHNSNGIADHVREMLKMPLRAAWESKRPILLLAHSMGSVIAYDSLWEMTHNEKDDLEVDLFLTMGSPLGQNYLRKRIMGHDIDGPARYPNNIRRWTNLSAIGDMTALDRELKSDFGEMIELGLVDSIDDRSLLNFFRLGGNLNVHAEYGYLVNASTGKIVVDWWRSVQRDSGAC